MSANDYISIISAIVAGVIAIIGAMAKLSGNRKKQLNANNATLNDNNIKLDAIHVLVNSRLEQALARIESLQKKLEDNNIDGEIHPPLGTTQEAANPPEVPPAQ